MREFRRLPGMSRLFLLVWLAASVVAVASGLESRVRFTGDSGVRVNGRASPSCDFQNGEELLLVKHGDILVVSADENVGHDCNVTISNHSVFDLRNISNYATFVLYGKPLNVTADTNVSLECPDATPHALVQIEVNNDISPGRTDSCCDPANLRPGCHRCGKGQYQEGLSCWPCQGGKTTEKSGVYSEDDCTCPHGYHDQGGECTLCTPGKFQTNVGGTQMCEDCGEYNNRGAGASNCTENPAVSPTEITKSHPQYLQPRATTCDRTCCVPGEYWNDDRQACVDCTDGYNYSNVSGATTCQNCGDLAAGEEMVGCFSSPGSKRDCKHGYYRPSGEGTRSCLVCEPGKTTSNTGAASETDCQCKPGFQTQEPFSNCTMCEQGTFKTTISSTDKCQQCSGEYQITLAKGSTSPSNCSCRAGYERNDEDQCRSCPSGKYKPEIGDTPCTPCESCPSGRLAHGCGGRDQGECKKCMDDDCDLDQTCDYCGICNYNKTYQDHLLSTNSSLVVNHTREFNSTLDLCGMCGGDITIAKGYKICHQCAPGTFGRDGPRVCNDTETSTNIDDIDTADQCRTCSDCPAGKYTDKSGSSACLDCPISAYANTTGQTTCAACGANMTTDAPGASGVEFCHCLPGFYHNHTNTTPATHECFRCDPGYYSVALNQHVCTKCPAGQHNNHSDHFDNSTYCTKCPVNTYSLEGAVDCNACVHATSPTGSTALANCSCDPGYAAEPGGYCSACAAGTYAENAGSSACLECVAGTFSDQLAALRCEECPENTYSSQKSTHCTSCPNSTSPNGSASLLNCTCKAGYSTNASATSTFEYCEACPAGKYKEDTELTFCTDCPSTTYSVAVAATSATVCTHCDSGKFSTPGTSVCFSCPDGMTSHNDTHCAKHYWLRSDGYQTSRRRTCAETCEAVNKTCNPLKPLTLTSIGTLQTIVYDIVGPILNDDRNVYCKCTEEDYYSLCPYYDCLNEYCTETGYAFDGNTGFATYGQGLCYTSRASSSAVPNVCNKLDDGSIWSFICACDEYHIPHV